jgi:drug/metabolite transporter (DMT)-like permease
MTAPRRQDSQRASLMMVLAMALFALEDLLVKYATQTLPVGQILVSVGLGGLAVAWPVARSRGLRVLSRDLLHPAILARSAAEVACTICFAAALALLPLATVSAILQALPLVVTMGAALILGERVGWRRWTAILAGLAGVLLILRPGPGGDATGAVLAVLAVLALAARDLATRRVPARIPDGLVTAWAFGALAVAGLIALPFGGPARMPDPATALALAGCVVFALGAYLALMAAIRGADIAVVAPFRYSRLLFGVGLGSVVFDERPDAWLLAGSALVVASGLYTLWREARLARAARPGDDSPSRDAAARL